MNTSPNERLPDGKTVMAASLEALAFALLEFTRDALPNVRPQPGIFAAFNTGIYKEFSKADKEKIEAKYRTAFALLVSRAMIGAATETPANGYILTEIGSQALEDGLEKGMIRSKLNPDLIHPKVRMKAYGSFLEGNFEAAVFEAFKVFEIEVRVAAGFSGNEYGVRMIRSAFDPNQGPLTDMNSSLPERENIAHLATGAYGSYRNPTGHFNVSIDEQQAIDRILLASHLVRLIVP